MLLPVIVRWLQFVFGQHLRKPLAGAAMVIKPRRGGGGASHLLGGGFRLLILIVILILIFIPIFKPTCGRCGLATHPKAPEDWRTPKRFALFASRQTTLQRLGLRRLVPP